jgi:DNA-binding transcriptional ArsR family regulator
MGLLGERPEVTIDRDEDPRLLCLDDEYTEEVLRRLSSETSQAVFRAVNREPLSAQDVAEELEMSVQNAMYHLENLEETGLITVLDTHYSERGREVDIYGPPDQPLLLFLGPSQDWPGLTAAFKEFASAVGPVAIPLAVGQFVSRLLGSDN